MDIGAWLSEQIEAHGVEREEDSAAAARLAEAYAALAGYGIDSGPPIPPPAG